MEPQLREFLVSRDITSDVIKQLEEDKIDSHVLRIMDETSLSRYIGSYGDRIAIIDFSKQLCGNKKRKEDFAMLIREKMQIKRQKTINPSSPEVSQTSVGNRNAVKSVRKIDLGWLNYDEQKGKYTQVRTKNGGGTRRTIVPKTATKVDLIALGKSLFLGKNTTEYEYDIFDFKEAALGAEMTVEGLYEFTQLPMLRYYLATKAVTVVPGSIAKNDSEINSEKTDTCSYIVTENSYSGSSSSVMSSKVTVSDRSDMTDSSCSFNTIQKVEKLPRLSALAVVSSDGDIHGQTQKIHISYCQEKACDSYSPPDIVSTITCHSIQECKNFLSFENPDILEENHFDPQDHNFSIRSIVVDDKVYQQGNWITNDLNESLYNCTLHYSYPQHDRPLNDVIIHHPDEIHGFDGQCLLIGAITDQEKGGPYNYSWFCDGKSVSGNNNILFVNRVGVYHVEVKVGESIVSKSRPLQVIEILLENKSVPVVPDQPGKAFQTQTSATSIPKISVNSLELTDADEIGHGTFGRVFKGKWAGSTVAIKKIDLLAKRNVVKVVQNEINMNGRVRHPNIVQLLAVASEEMSSEIYLVSEFINGSNMEQVIFNSKTQIDHINKRFIAAQCLQGLAYLHALSPAILHQDIKPANILIQKQTFNTKLCDLGVSRIKSLTTSTKTCTSFGIGGSPAYMAPERLVRP